jgi:hypothetical protein
MAYSESTWLSHPKSVGSLSKDHFVSAEGANAHPADMSAQRFTTNALVNALIHFVIDAWAGTVGGQVCVSCLPPEEFTVLPMPLPFPSLNALVNALIHFVVDAWTGTVGGRACIFCLPPEGFTLLPMPHPSPTISAHFCSNRFPKLLFLGLAIAGRSLGGFWISWSSGFCWSGRPNSWIRH